MRPARRVRPAPAISLTSRAYTLTPRPSSLSPTTKQETEDFTYRLPADFEDEEIDEDEAFNSEDEARYYFRVRHQLSQDARFCGVRASWL